MRDIENSMVRDGYDPWEPTADERASYEEYMAGGRSVSALDWLKSLVEEEPNGDTKKAGR